MKVLLVKHTENPIDTVYSAGKLCINGLNYWENIIEATKIHSKIKKSLIKTILESGHHSILEHLTLTFSISGISRACGRQLLRSRIMSPTESSQRSINMNNVEMVKPLSIASNKDTNRVFDETMKVINYNYKELLKLGVPVEDARAVLPNATPTDIVITLNFRELIKMCNDRLCFKAQNEIRLLANELKDEVRECLGEFWSNMLKPKCVLTGQCNERKSCGYINTIK